MSPKVVDLIDQNTTTQRLIDHMLVVHDTTLDPVLF